MSFPAELLWALIGLILTIGGTFLEASITNAPWNWGDGLQTHSLGVSLQIGAVLLVGCVGGKTAALMSQLAYLFVGLILGLNVFTQGGGLDYVQLPPFGYILGFAPGAWVCGWLAFKVPNRLESLAFSSLCGLMIIHLCGIAYLAIAHGLHLGEIANGNWFNQVLTYSVHPLPGQFAILCAVTVIAFILRVLLFY